MKPQEVGGMAPQEVGGMEPQEERWQWDARVQLHCPRVRGDIDNGQLQRVMLPVELGSWRGLTDRRESVGDPPSAACAHSCTIVKEESAGKEGEIPPAIEALRAAGLDPGDGLQGDPRSNRLMSD